MSHLQVIERLEQMLHVALDIIKEQETLLSQHGIVTDSGKLEEQRRKFADDMDKYV